MSKKRIGLIDNLDSAFKCIESIGQWRGFEFMILRETSYGSGDPFGWSVGWTEPDFSGFEWRVKGWSKDSLLDAINEAILKVTEFDKEVK